MSGTETRFESEYVTGTDCFFHALVVAPAEYAVVRVPTDSIFLNLTVSIVALVTLVSFASLAFTSIFAS